MSLFFGFRDCKSLSLSHATGRCRGATIREIPNPTDLLRGEPPDLAPLHVPHRESRKRLAPKLGDGVINRLQHSPNEPIPALYNGELHASIAPIGRFKNPNLAGARLSIIEVDALS